VTVALVAVTRVAVALVAVAEVADPLLPLPMLIGLSGHGAAEPEPPPGLEATTVTRSPLSEQLPAPAWL
jgi:hypothetical protein